MPDNITNQVESVPIPAGISSYSELKNKPKTQNEEMGQKEFLLLFTTQLQNQNPLDPMDNEAFVAQLAQFSQLEATVNMSESMTGLVDTLKGDRMLQGANLIGKKVMTGNGHATLEEGKNISAVISLPNGADKIELTVYDMSGAKIHQASTGRRMPGDVTISWDGTDGSGKRLEPGEYRIVANVASLGENVQIPITTPSVIKSVTYSAEDSDLILETVGGGSVRLSKVNKIEN
tara:strand:+ start:336 stop:1034 length:699 start_codon:yes stop_codon:yes gene_type:complete